MTFPFKIPFATSGNQTAIPETDLSGFVNFTDGYTPDYELDPETDPNGKVIERDKWNWLFNRITAAIGEAQKNGCAEWYSEFSPYRLGSVVSRAGKIWQSTIANNSTEPGNVGANWIDITALAATETDYGRVILATQADADPATIGAANNTKAATILRAIQALRSAPAKSAILDAVRPVGSHYIQFAESDGSFSSAKSPSNLFGGTWALKFNTESVYFRTEGTLAASNRSGGIQGDAIRNIYGEFYSIGGGGVVANGAILANPSPHTQIQAGVVSGTNTGFVLDASKTVPTAAENRVKNRLIRVWERTA